MWQLNLYSISVMIFLPVAALTHQHNPYINPASVGHMNETSSSTVKDASGNGTTTSQSTLSCTGKAAETIPNVGKEKSVTFF